MPVPGLDRPPLPSPDIQSQQGAPEAPPPGAGLGSIAAKKPGPGGPTPGAPDPNGAIVAQVEAIKKVLESMANTEPMMAPFASRATAILDSGIAAVRAAPKSPSGTGGDVGPIGQGASPPPAPGGPGQGPPMA
jgi:hypothetical protein